MDRLSERHGPADAGEMQCEALRTGALGAWGRLVEPPMPEQRSKHRFGGPSLIEARLRLQERLEDAVHPREGQLQLRHRKRGPQQRKQIARQGKRRTGSLGSGRAILGPEQQKPEVRRVERPNRGLGSCRGQRRRPIGRAVQHRGKHPHHPLADECGGFAERSKLVARIHE